MKKIDKLLTTSFVAPFVMTFSIALFVLIMVFFWTYIDDIVGKGVGLALLTELVFYLSVSMFPMALSIAVLISSVMVMGNLAEHYELASLKSAGIPLWRVMLPLMFVASSIAIFSFFCSNNLIPVANLQFKSRLYDIRKAKPTLSLEKGIFNYDFKGFVIRIGDKGEDNRSISDVLIYDHNNYNQGSSTRILAEKGEMYTTDDKKFFIMNLINGTQYQKTERKKKDGKGDSHSFVRTNFKEWNKVFDLQEFEMQETQKDLFKSHQSMLTSWQLVGAIDSIEAKIANKYQSLSNLMLQTHFPLNKFMVKREIKKPKPNPKEKTYKESKTKKPAKKEQEENSKKREDAAKKEAMKKEAAEAIKKARADRANKASIAAEKAKAEANKKAKEAAKKKAEQKRKEAAAKAKKTKQNQKPKNAVNRSNRPLKQEITKPLKEYNTWLETVPRMEKLGLYSRAKSSLRTLASQAESTARTMDQLKESRVKHIYQLHEKFSMAAVCLIFLFIGAPMGAIIRKGGFGYPILFSIFFFILFIVMNIFCKKVAETFVLDALLAAWLPNLILFPIGIILTYRAMNDSKVINLDKYTTFFRNLFSKKEKKSAELS